MISNRRFRRPAARNRIGHGFGLRGSFGTGQIPARLGSILAWACNYLLHVSPCARHYWASAVHLIATFRYRHRRNLIRSCSSSRSARPEALATMAVLSVAVSHEAIRPVWACHLGSLKRFAHGPRIYVSRHANGVYCFSRRPGDCPRIAGRVGFPFGAESPMRLDTAWDCCPSPSGY